MQLCEKGMEREGFLKVSPISFLLLTTILLEVFFSMVLWCISFNVRGRLGDDIYRGKKAKTFAYLIIENQIQSACNSFWSSFVPLLKISYMFYCIFISTLLVLQVENKEISTHICYILTWFSSLILYSMCIFKWIKVT